MNKNMDNDRATFMVLYTRGTTIYSTSPLLLESCSHGVLSDVRRVTESR